MDVAPIEWCICTTWMTIALPGARKCRLEQGRDRAQIAVHAHPFRLPETLEEARLGRRPELRGATQALPSLGRHVHCLASLPAFGAQPNPPRPLERLEVATQRRAIHRH